LGYPLKFVPFAILGIGSGLALADPGHLVGWAEVAGSALAILVALWSVAKKVNRVDQRLENGDQKFNELYKQNDEIEQRLNLKIDGIKNTVDALVAKSAKNPRGLT
jgi:hypothetical protein